MKTQNSKKVVKAELQFVLLSLDANLIDTYIKPVYIFYATAFLILATLFFIAITFRISIKKTKKFKFNNTIRENVEQWITELLSVDELTGITVPDEFMELSKNTIARQFIIEELIKNKTSFLGSISDNIIKLYCELGLNADSKAKLDDRREHVQCQGIHELCVMDQKDVSKKVYQLANSEDYDVRMEAQTAIIQWFGFFGLRFLNVISFPITEFQQLKLLELLRHLPFTGLPDLPRWLQSSNYTVVQFALKLAEHYNQVQLHDEVSGCLTHENESVRNHAERTLEKFTKGSTVAIGSDSFTARLKYFTTIGKDYSKWKPV